MDNITYTILLVALLLPFVVYLCVKLGTFAFYRARQQSQEKVNGQQEREVPS